MSTNIPLQDMTKVASSSNSSAAKVIEKTSSNSSRSNSQGVVEDVNNSRSFWDRFFNNKFFNSFRRQEAIPSDSNVNKAAQKAKGLSSRHVALIAIGGGLGTGLLVGNGKALGDGGPAALLIGYAIIGIMVFMVMSAAGELAVAFKTMPGGFNGYTSQLVDRSLAFAVSWNYCINWMTVLPLELVTATMTIKYWNNAIDPSVFITIFLLFVYATNFFGAKGYAEAEFWMNLLKIVMLLIFIISGIVLDCGAGGKSEYIGFKYFKDPGAFANGFKGVCSVFVTSAFSLGGTEFMALTAADQKNPKRAIPKAMKYVFYRLVIFYFGSILLVGMLVAYNSSKLMGSGNNNGAPTSPYVIAMDALAPALGHLMNGVILVALLSVANSALYSSSRTLYSLSTQGFAPTWFDCIDRNGRPTRAMLVSVVCGLFSYIASYEKQEAIFTWLLSLSALAAIFTWLSICIAHIRFRAALKAQTQKVEDLEFASPFGVWGSYIASLIMVFVLVVQFWCSLWPISNGGKVDVKSFFQSYTGLFVFLVCYIGHKCLPSSSWRPFIAASEIDIETHRVIKDADQKTQEAIEEKTRWDGKSWIQKFFDYIG